MLSVMMPVNVCLPWAADSPATARRLKIRCFITSPFTEISTCPLEIDGGDAARARRRLLFARYHEVGGRRARIHDPHATLLGVVGQSGCLRRGARHGDGHVRAS